MMERFLLAHGAGQAGDRLLDDCLNQLGDIPPEANFGFLYLSDHLADAAEPLLDRLKLTTGITAWVGTQFGFGLVVPDFWTGLLGALVISIVSFLLSTLFRDDDRPRRN